MPRSEDIRTRFHELHEERFGYSDPEREIEAVTVRVRAWATPSRPSISPERAGPPAPDPARVGEGRLRLPGEPPVVDHYDRSKLLHGMKIGGGALVLEYSATTYIPSGWNARIDAYRNLVIERRKTG